MIRPVQNELPISVLRENLQESDVRPLLIDQIKAANYTSNVLAELQHNGVLNADIPEHKAILETDVYRLRRGLCLPSAVSTSINLVSRRKVIGDNDGILKVGDFYRYLLPHHGHYISDAMKRGWLVVTDTGDMYHHAVVAFAEGLGYTGQSVAGFDTLEKFRAIIAGGGSASVSMNNRFVIEQTLTNSPENIKVDGEVTQIKVQTAEGQVFRRFEDGRHVVTIVGFEEDTVTIADSFNLPQIGDNGMLVTLPIKTADTYLRYHDQAMTRGVVITKERHHLDGLKSTDLLIPDEVRSDLSKKLRPFIQSI